MKSDSYLNLCIEQAHLSPLHYRHGSVVVKGGKVIGQGFNDYRPGYDGGSVLKSGVLPKSVSPSVDSFTHDKDSDLPKSNLKNNTSKMKFKPVETVTGNCGGGHHANSSLSMHSEMMAINSALASSSTLAASTAQHIKPCFKLFSDSKRKRELRRETLSAYVRAVCLDAACGANAQQQQQCTGKTQTDEWRFELFASGCDCVSSEDGLEKSSTSPPTKREAESESETNSSASLHREESSALPVQQWAQVQTVQVA